MTVSEDVVASQGRLSGWVLKGSDVVNGLACWRFGVLEGNKFLSYRSEDDEKPSAIWPLHYCCEVSKLEQRDIHVRAKGKSTFVALVAGRYGKIDGFQFVVSWPNHIQPRAGKANKLILGFELETTAARWQTAFLQSVEELVVTQQEAEISSPPLPMDSPPHPQGTSDQRNEDFIDLDSPTNKKKTMLQASTMDKHSQLASQTSFYDVEPICRSISFGSSIVGEAQSPDASLRTRNIGFWSPWKHVNGLAIYKEDDPSEGVEAFMVSCIVRSSPSVCFQTLMAGNKDNKCTIGNGSSDFLNMDILEKLEENVDFVHGCLAPRGWCGFLLARRDIVLERNWRKEEEDGTYIVVLKSTNKYLTQDINSKGGGCQKDTFGKKVWDPIRAQVLASVFTIAPLKDKYFPNGLESPEALVTMVLKIDLGGILSPSSLFYPLSQLLCNKDSWIESILMTVVSLRDRVEQSRFVSLPFSVDSTSTLGQPSQPMLSPDHASHVYHWSESERHDFANLDASTMFPNKECTTEAESSSVPRGLEMETSPDFRKTGTCDPAYWMCPGAAGYRVRGPTYLTDRKKIPASEPMFDLYSVDLVKLKQPTTHIARFLTSVKECPSAFAFVLQIMVPGPPDLALVITWGSKDEGPAPESSSMNMDSYVDAPTETEQDLLPFEMSLMRFVTGDDETRNSSFKLIPHIIKGSFIIRQSVGSTPVLLGRKLKQYYFKHQNYIEVDVDVGSSYTAATVVNMVSGVTRTLVVDLAIVLEGKSVEELPEALLGTVRLDRLDLATAVYLDTDEKNIQQTTDIDEERVPSMD